MPGVEMLTPRALRDLRRPRSRAQAMVLMILFLMLLIGVAGLAADGGHVYLNKRNVQNAADSAALAAGEKLAAEANGAIEPQHSTDAPVLAANAFAANNGYDTTLSSACDSTASGGFTTTWVSNGSCSSASSATTSVTVNDPPVGFGDNPSPPPQCSGTFGCLQVIIKSRVTNFLMGVFGIPQTEVNASAVVDASTGSPGGGTLPPTNAAVYLYEPHSAFDATQTPVHAAATATTSGMVCTSSCPTYWTTHGSQPMFDGYNASGSGTDYPALESNGDMVIMGKTTFCDPTGGTCQQGQKIGADGYAYNTGTGSQIYCKQQNTTTPGACTTTGQLNLDQLWGTPVGFSSQSWTPTIPAQTNDCSGLNLVLNGQSVYSATSAYPACQPPSSAAYTIMPGIYNSITVNHGAYEFGQGVFVINGHAPVNSTGPSTGCNGNHSYAANGIDHCNENTANDIDLCYSNGSDAESCPNLTAGVWIGHGSGEFTAASTGTSGTCTGSSTGADGGGGDQTQVTGTGVTFVLKTSGFVSTNEVQLINLSSPGPSSLSSPILLDDESSAMMHLDAGSPPPGNAYSRMAGIIYQNPAAAGGGVEFDDTLTHNNGGAITGQVLAYSMTVWGGLGTAVDFSAGWGANSPQIGTSGHNESSIISSVSKMPTASSQYPGDETVSFGYTDEWSLDAYDVYIRINGGSPVFFSQNEWGPQPAANSTLPPSVNLNPDDTVGQGSYPATTGGVPGSGAPSTTPTYPTSTGTYYFANGAPATGYTVATDATTGKNDDFTEQVGTGSSASHLEVLGAWTWGHQKDIGTNPTSGAYNATINYTFPTPAGNTVNLTIFMTDGDHCGDYATASFTLNNVGNSTAGTPGTVVLLQ